MARLQFLIGGRAVKSVICDWVLIISVCDASAYCLFLRSAGGRLLGRIFLWNGRVPSTFSDGKQGHLLGPDASGTLVRRSGIVCGFENSRSLPLEQYTDRNGL